MTIFLPLSRMETLRTLRGLPAWLMLACSLSAAGQFLTISTLVVLFMENYALDHETAATLYGLYGMLAGGVGLLVALPLDTLHVTPVLAGGLAASALLRAGMAAAGSTGDWRLAFGALLAAATSDVLWGTVLDLALQRAVAAKPKPRGIIGKEDDDEEEEDEERYKGNVHSNRVFALQYALVNVAAVLSSLGYQALRDHAATLAAANTYALYAAALLHLLAFAVLLPGLGELRLQDEDRIVSGILEAHLLGKHEHEGEHAAGPSPWAVLRATLRQRSFWAFTGLCTVLLGVRMVFRHLDTTLPVVMQRTPGLGGERAPFPLVQAVNPALIIPLAPALQWWLAEVPSYPVIALGTLVSTLSVGAAVLGNWARPDPASAALPLVGYVAFVALFSLGEALWSARFTSYALTLAPPERQATYRALAALPGLAAKLPTALFSGWIVAHYCPPEACDAAAVWLWVGGMAATTPLVLFAGWQWLNHHHHH